jgi:hypothetical protein
MKRNELTQIVDKTEQLMSNIHLRGVIKRKLKVVYCFDAFILE